MDKLCGNPKKIFKIISKRYKSNNLINSDEMETLFSNSYQLEEDLSYLSLLGLIYIDDNWYYHLTTKGRLYFKYRTSLWIELFIKSIFCPIIVAFFTTLITLWLKG